MQRSAFRFLCSLIVTSMLLSACGAAAPTVAPTPTRARVATLTQVPATVAPTAAATATAAAPSATKPATAASATPVASAPTATKAAATATTAAAKPTAAPAAPMASPEYGVHVFLGYSPEATARDVKLAKDGGFTWIKQRMDWDALAPDEQGQMKPDVLAKYDQIVAAANAAGLKLIIRVGSPPKWATSLRSVAPNPPPDDLGGGGPMANFLYGLASRYAGKVAAWQIWNEPNLKREWGKSPDAAEYDRLLKSAYHAIKAADPNAIVISAGLSPTGVTPPEAAPDDWYLEQMYQAFDNRSSAGYFDVLGAHGAGYKASPDMDPATAASNPDYGGHRSFAFRRVEDLRAVMVKYGDSNKQVALLEFGWVIDGGEKLDPSYRWYAVSPEKQAEYIAGAYKWAKEHWAPWIGVMSVIYILSPDVKDTTEYYWWGITNPDGTPRPAYNAIKAWRAAGN